MKIKKTFVILCSQKIQAAFQNVKLSAKTKNATLLEGYKQLVSLKKPTFKD